MRKQVQVYSGINELIQEIKDEIGLGSASEVIGYLYFFYKGREKEITMEEHKRAIALTKEKINQQSM